MKLNEEVIKFTDGIELPKNLLSKEFKEFCRAERISVHTMFMYGINQAARYTFNAYSKEYEEKYYRKGTLNKGLTLAGTLLFYKLYKEGADAKLGKRTISISSFVEQDVIDFLEIDFPKELIGDSDLVKLLGFMSLLVDDKRSKYYKTSLEKIFEEL